MLFWESYRIGLRAIRSNRLRSLLTMLGIVIGVASVITMVAVGAGAQQKIAEQIRALGANVLLVFATNESSEERTRHALIESDAEAITKEIAQVSGAAPFAWKTGEVIRANKNMSVALWGITPDYFHIRQWSLAAGRSFLALEEAGAAKVAVVGARVAEQLFGAVDPVGSEVRIGDVPFRIVGVLNEVGVSAGSNDRAVFMPLSTLKRRLPGTVITTRRDSIDYILVKAASESAVEPARKEIDRLLRRRHQIAQDRSASFDIGNPAAELAAQRGTATAFAWLMASVASVSLIVGGISIMNIMLVSVTERTREIGLRMAVGARRRDIRDQFLMEATTLCLLGGVVGLVIGTTASIFIASLAGWPIQIGLGAIVLAIGFAAAVGIFFGWYPAYRAARLEPVEALRIA